MVAITIEVDDKFILCVTHLFVIRVRVSFWVTVQIKYRTFFTAVRIRCFTGILVQAQLRCCWWIQV